MHWLRPAAFVSLFYWAIDNHQLTHGAKLASFAVLLAVAIAASLAASAAFRHLDVR